MAHSPTVLAGYSALRRATAEHGTLGQPVSAALMLATAVAVGNDYAVAITSRLAHAGGWTEEQLAEAFACFGPTIFTAYFLNYAETELDLPAGPAPA